MRELVFDIRVYVCQQGLALAVVDVFQQGQVQLALRRLELAAQGEAVVDHRRVDQRRQTGLHQRRQLRRDQVTHLRIIKACRRPGTHVVVEAQVDFIGSGAARFVIEHEVAEDARLQGGPIHGFFQVRALQALIEPGVDRRRHFLCCLF
ncbi:hypothetical protein D3C81_1575780 [compost metagenome]